MTCHKSGQPYNKILFEENHNIFCLLWVCIWNGFGRFLYGCLFNIILNILKMQFMFSFRFATILGCSFLHKHKHGLTYVS